YRLILESESNEDVKVIILSGSGKHFTSGSNVKAMGNRKVHETIDHMSDFNEIIKKISLSEKIFISAVQGFCIGGGTGIALASDITFAADNAKFGFTFSKIGLIPDCGTLYFLPRLVGKKKAKELIFNAEIINSNQALELGIVNELLPKEDLMDKAFQYAKQLVNGPSLALSWTKKIINQSDLLSLEDVLEYERLGQTIMQQSEDHKEGVKAFKEKRKPNFIGR
ncbi:MAG TPA: enoyl-CoA hydratase-related protein, partial [Candidatus Dormibacteraeota bacterium]|nr:enoyl-CoA hydratase-related protein [Candidatus Dormibacteraeota bacterium]